MLWFNITIFASIHSSDHEISSISIPPLTDCRNISSSNLSELSKESEVLTSQFITLLVVLLSIWTPNIKYETLTNYKSLALQHFLVAK